MGSIYNSVLLFWYIFISVGGQWDSRVGGRLFDRSLWSNSLVAYCWGSFPYPYRQTPGSAPARAERCSSPVSRGFQHPRLPQHAEEGHRWREAALGLPKLRPRSWLPQLGQPRRRTRRKGGPGAGMSHVSRSRALRASVAGLWGGVLSGCGPSHSCVQPMRPRVLRKNSSILESNPSSSRNAHLPRRVSFLRPAAQRRAGIHQTDLPGACGLNTPAYDLLP